MQWKLDHETQQKLIEDVLVAIILAIAAAVLHRHVRGIVRKVV